ncbi:MAG: SDR family oxidoreductase [Cytophagales bacterium]|nr:SDR family oxidoreductase [Cytophagales bacterium]
MKKTVVITGASSGIGKITAQYFLEKGWNVAATMRNPQNEKELKESDTLKLIKLDVENTDTIQSAVNETIKNFGKIDVWVNNAGYGAKGPTEAGTRAQIQRQYDVNFFGVIDCIKAIVPHFRVNKSGVIINISSIGGLLTIPMYAVYNSSKFAVEGLTEGLYYELGIFGIKVKLVEPGGIKTDFQGRSEDTWGIEKFPEYAAFVSNLDSKYHSEAFRKNLGNPIDVAKTIYSAATDGTDRLRYLVGKDAKQFWFIRRWFGYKVQMSILKKYLGIKSL